MKMELSPQSINPTLNYHPTHIPYSNFSYCALVLPFREIEVAREVFCVDFYVIAVFAGLARNSRDKMTATCGSEHIEKVYVASNTRVLRINRSFPERN